MKKYYLVKVPGSHVAFASIAVDDKKKKVYIYEIPWLCKRKIYFRFINPIKLIMLPIDYALRGYTVIEYKKPRLGQKKEREEIHRYNKMMREKYRREHPEENWPR